MASVYILLSLKDHRTYTGSTVDLKVRFLQHQKGKVAATRYRLPVQLMYSEEFSTLIEARRKEKYYKTAAGRRKMKKILSHL